MNDRLSQTLLLVSLLFFCQLSFAQYILNGSAKKVSCNCYTLTEEQTFQSGSVWNSNKVDLRNSFDFWFNVFLGCKDDNGADGIVFILQPISTSVGTSGEGMGFAGVKPSIGIALDTWQNLNLSDPSFDHISIQANGETNHNNDLVAPVPVSATSNNVEDCQWHVLRIAWDAGAKNLKAYFDGELRVEKQIDLVSTIFNNDPAVFWGFTGATGGSVNLQQFCTALNPIVTTSTPANRVCEDEPVQFKDASESFAPIIGYNWNFGDGTFSSEKNPLPHTYAEHGQYQVNLKIKGQDGCEKDSTFTVSVGSVPNGSFIVTDTCVGFAPTVHLTESNTEVSYQWLLDNVPISTEKVPFLSSVPQGSHELKMVITSNFSCGVPATQQSGFLIKPAPELLATVQDGCVNEALFFQGTQTDNATTIDRWHWNFGDGVGDVGQNASHLYNAQGTYNVELWAHATNGCLSQAVVTPANINAALAFAGHDTAVIKGVPFQLQGSGTGSFLWSPATGLSNPGVIDPVAQLENDQQYILTAMTPEGCIAKDTVLIKTFTGPAIYVPTAFTPNGDGKNETLRPVYVGIRELKQFSVFNRWGQLVFTTNQMQKSWEGRDAMPGTYVWLIRAVNALGQSIVQKGTVTIIR